MGLCRRTRCPNGERAKRFDGIGRGGMDSNQQALVGHGGPVQVGEFELSRRRRPATDDGSHVTSG